MNTLIFNLNIELLIIN